MAEKKQEKTEKEYVISLRKKYKHAVRYKKTPKAIKSIKEFLVNHMKIYDRDLNKIKIDQNVNEYMWARGIKNPPHKIKVKAVKEGDIVRVSLVDLPAKLKYKKLREEKLEREAKDIKEKKKSVMEKAKETMQGKKEEKPEEKSEEDKRLSQEARSGSSISQAKVIAEKKEAVAEEGQALEKSKAKQAKHSVGGKDKQPKRPIRQVMNK